MKTKIFTLLTLLVLCNNLFSQNAWRQLNVDNSKSFLSAIFSDNEYGWVVGDQGAVYKTINGGETWLSSNVNSGAVFYGINFSSGGMPWLISWTGDIYTSNDFVNWIHKYTIPNNHNFQTICGNDIGDMFAIGDGAYKSSDNGDSWSSVDIPLHFYTDMDYYGQTCVLVGNEAAVCKSTNNGETWGPVDIGSIDVMTFTGVYMVDVNTWILIANDGKILRTNDGGSSFTLIESNTTVQLWDVKFNLDNGIIVGQSGTILKSVDAGLTWTLQNSGVTTNLTSVALTNSNLIYYACGSNGVVLKTESGGETPFLNVSTSAFTFAADQNLTDNFDIDANTIWEVNCSENWFFTDLTIYHGNYTVNLTIDVNTLPISRTGTITVTGSGITRTITVSQDASASVQDLSTYGISIFPNPTNNMLYIDNVPSGLEQIRIMDVSGRCHIEINADEIGNRIDLSVLPAGLYFVIFDIDDKQAVGKVVIRKQ